MNIIKNIPIYKKELIDPKGKKYSLKKDVNIESSINKVLDSVEELCNYYIIIDEAKWVVAYNFDKSEYQQKSDSMFEIRLMNDDNKNRYVINITKEPYEFNHWNNIIHKIEKEVKRFLL